MVRDGVVSDQLWEILEPLLPARAGRPGRPWNDHRLTLEGIIWRFRTGSPWRDLPEQFGPYQSVWQRHRLWSTDGTYEQMLGAVREQVEASGLDAQELASIDSMIVRAHQHAAGARRDSVQAEAEQDTGGTLELQESGRRTRRAA